MTNGKMKVGVIGEDNATRESTYRTGCTRTSHGLSISLSTSFDFMCTGSFLLLANHIICLSSLDFVFILPTKKDFDFIRH